MARDVTPQTFEAQVIEASCVKPVVVDLWAPWCQPCLRLAPILEALADESDRWTLVKIDVQQHQALAAQLQVQGIPDLRGFVDGKIVERRLGAGTRADLQAWIETFVLAPADGLLADAEQAMTDGDQVAAIAAFERVLMNKPRHEGATVGLAGAHLLSGNLDEADQLIEDLEGPEAAQMRLRVLARRYPVDVERKHGGVAERLAFGIAEAVGGRFETALEALLEVVSSNRAFRDDSARKAMLDVFRVAANHQEVVDEFRRRLATLLF